MHFTGTKTLDSALIEAQKPASGVWFTYGCKRQSDFALISLGFSCLRNFQKCCFLESLNFSILFTAGSYSAIYVAKWPVTPLQGKETVPSLISFTKTAMDILKTNEFASKKEKVHNCVNCMGQYTFFYTPSKMYIVKLPLALSNIFSFTESILVQSHDDAKNPYWGINMDFWHCLVVMTYS